MRKPPVAKTRRRLFVERDIERLREQLAKFQPFLSRRKHRLSLEEFDAAAERLLGRVFGETSELLETYAYAKLGEAAGLVNMPEEAQESGAHDVERESLHQRKQVLESAIAELVEAGEVRWPARRCPITCPRTCAASTRMPRSRRRGGCFPNGGSVRCWWTITVGTSASSRIRI
jgi:hypothetical protein